MFFSSEPGHIHMIQHEICMIPGKVIHQRPYRVPEARRESINAKARSQRRISECLVKPYCSGSQARWNCNDFIKLNEVSQFKSYPIPHIDELIVWLGKARFITTLDLTKGYWAGSSFSSIQKKRQPSLPQRGYTIMFIYLSACMGQKYYS